MQKLFYSTWQTMLLLSISFSLFPSLSLSRSLSICLSVYLPVCLLLSRTHTRSPALSLSLPLSCPRADSRTNCLSRANALSLTCSPSLLRVSISRHHTSRVDVLFLSGARLYKVGEFIVKLGHAAVPGKVVCVYDVHLIRLDQDKRKSDGLV